MFQIMFTINSHNEFGRSSISSTSSIYGAKFCSINVLYSKVDVFLVYCTVHPYCSLLHNPVIDVLPVRDRLQCEHFLSFCMKYALFCYSVNCHSTYLLKYHALSPFGEFIIYFYELISGRFLPKASLCVSSANRNVKNSEAFGMSLIGKA